MTETTHKVRHLTGGWLTVSEGWSMTIVVGSNGGRQADMVLEMYLRTTYLLIHRQETERLGLV